MNLLEVLAAGKTLLFPVTPKYPSKTQEGKDKVDSKIKLEHECYGKMYKEVEIKIGICIIYMEDKEMKFNARVISKSPLSGEGKEYKKKIRVQEWCQQDGSVGDLDPAKKKQQQKKMDSYPWTKISLEELCSPVKKLQQS